MIEMSFVQKNLLNNGPRKACREINYYIDNVTKWYLAQNFQKINFYFYSTDNLKTNLRICPFND